MSENEELHNDLAEASAIDASMDKHGPGRPAGSKNKSTSRTEIRRRVAAHRERKRLAAEEAAEVAEEESRQQQRFFRQIRTEGLLFFGETAPLKNCISICEEIEMARLWARLLGAPDIEVGQNKRAYITGVLKSWCDAECPLLNLKTQTLSNRKADVPDVEQYVWLDGADASFESEIQEETQT